LNRERQRETREIERDREVERIRDSELRERES
jgi:hypothetical protein